MDDLELEDLSNVGQISEDDAATMAPAPAPVPTDKADPRNRLRDYLQVQMKRQQMMRSPEMQRMQGERDEGNAKAADNAALGGLLMNSAAQFGNIGGKTPDSSAASHFADQLQNNQKTYLAQNAQRQAMDSAEEDKKLKMYQYLAAMKQKEMAANVPKPAKMLGQMNEKGEYLVQNPDGTVTTSGIRGYQKPDKDLTVKSANELASDWDKHPETKNTRAVQTAYGKMQGADNSAAGDMSLIYGFMKMQDPNSTVREGEYASAENARGVPDKLRSMYNKIMSGERLTPEQRTQFRLQAKSIYDSQLATQKQVDERVRGLAKKRGVNPDDLLITDWQKEMPMARQTAKVPHDDGTAIAAEQQVKIKAPDGSIRLVPVSSKNKYLKKGGTLVE